MNYSGSSAEITFSNYYPFEIQVFNDLLLSTIFLETTLFPFASVSFKFTPSTTLLEVIGLLISFLSTFPFYPTTSTSSSTNY